ncbi:MAG: triple gene block protein 3 [Physalis virus X]|nr:MAG: triple gene block protein 3 [Physalis virus X]
MDFLTVGILLISIAAALCIAFLNLRNNQGCLVVVTGERVILQNCELTPEILRALPKHPLILPLSLPDC